MVLETLEVVRCFVALKRNTHLQSRLWILIIPLPLSPFFGSLFSIVILSKLSCLTGLFLVLVLADHICLILSRQRSYSLGEVV
jgi:hypothetical protein